jgi:hypothetical protein
MPDYRVTIKLRMGESKSGIRYYTRHNTEDVRKHFEKKVYGTYPNYLVEKILIESCGNVERKTCWEIHPITDIVVLTP